MRRTRRSSSPEIIVDRLSRKHAELDARVRELSRHTYLSPVEQMAERALKKRKLAMKDAMLDLEPSA